MQATWWSSGQVEKRACPFECTRKIYLGGIPCVSTMSVLIRTCVCIIRRDCWCPKTVILARQSSLLLGRMASADVSVRRDWWRRHGASRNSIITFLNDKRLRLASVCTHYSVVEMDRIIGRITVRLCSRLRNRKRFWRFSPSLAALRVSSLIIML